MATPGELTRALAVATGVPEATVSVYDRHLRDAGLRSRHGRGRGAAKVTARDAAHLLVAILGSGAVKEAAETVERYGRTRPEPAASGTQPYGDSGIVELVALGPDHSFPDAVAALLAAAATGSLVGLVVGKAATDVEARGPVLIDIAALTPGTAGDIRIAGLPGGAVVNVRYLTSEADCTGEARVRKAGAEIDLEQYRRVSERTIAGIAAVLGGRNGEAA